MRMSWLILAVAFGSGVATASAKDARDRTFAPDRVGAVTVASTPAQLRSVYGAANVRIGKHRTADEEFEGIVIFPGQRDEVRLYYNKGRTRLESAEIGPKPSSWRTADGVRVGMKLADLERINGGPLTLAYSELTGGGMSAQEKQGKLVGFIFHMRIAGKLSPAEHRRIESARSMRSDNPLVRKAALQVWTIQVPFDPQ